MAQLEVVATILDFSSCLLKDLPNSKIATCSVEFCTEDQSRKIMAEFHMIQEGYSSLENGIMKANASCILVMTPANTIIVDTLTPWDSEVIKKSKNF